MLFEPHRYQPQAWTLLSRSYQTERVASAYLFYGHEGVGQWPLALAFSALLNCTDRKTTANGDSIPCGGCPSCRAIVSNNSPNLLFAMPLRPKTERREEKQDDSDAVRELLEKQQEEPFRLNTYDKQLSIPIELARNVQKRLSLKAEQGSVRVAIFFEMEKMRADAADSLLKLIEEPPHNTIIILTTAHEHAIPTTIRSRSQEIRLRRLPAAMIQEYLIERYEQPSEKASVMARTCGGSIGRAISMAAADEDSGFDRNVGFRLFRSLLEDSNAETVSHVLDLVSDKDRNQAEELLTLWQTLIRDCAGYEATSDSNYITNVDFQQEIIKTSHRFADPVSVAASVEVIKNTLADLRRNVHIHGSLVALSMGIKGHLLPHTTGR